MNDLFIARHFRISVKDFRENNPQIFEQEIGFLGEQVNDIDRLNKVVMRYKHDKAHTIWEFLLWVYDNGYSLVKHWKRFDGDGLALVQKSLDERKRAFKKHKYEEVGEPDEIKFIKCIKKRKTK